MRNRPGRSSESLQRLTRTRPSVINRPSRGVAVNRADEVESDEEAETLWERFWKDTVWGAGQGALEMAADFFRNHRWGARKRRR